MLSYDTCTHESIKHIPYEVIFGHLARLPSSDPLREGIVVPTYKGYLIDLVTRLNGIQKLLYDNLISSKFRSKKYYDRSINPKKRSHRRLCTSFIRAEARKVRKVRKPLHRSPQNT